MHLLAWHGGTQDGVGTREATWSESGRARWPGWRRGAPQEGAAETRGIYFWRCGGCSVSLVTRSPAPRGKPQPQATNSSLGQARGFLNQGGGGVSPTPNPTCMGHALLPILVPALSGGLDP